MFRSAAFLGMMALLIPAWAFGQSKTTKKDPAAKQLVEAPALETGLRYQSQNHRDPFLNLLALRKQQELKSTDEEVPRGQQPPGIAGMYIAQVMLLGISTSEEERTAIFRGTDKRAYFLRASDRLFDGYVKKIGIDDVTVVRETRLRSGKVLTQEVTKRLRTP